MDENTTSESQAKRSSFNPIVIVIVLILLIGAGALLLSNSHKAQAPTAMQPSPTAAAMKEASPTTMMKEGASPSGTMMSEKTEEVTVNGGNYYFKPSKLTVKKGDTVKVTFMNDGGFHNFIIDEFNVKTNTIGSGKTATVSFTADKAGTFHYYCGVANHKAMGMVGTLTVQ